MNTEKVMQYDYKSDCESGINYVEIRELYEGVKERYPFSAEEFLAWKMFDLGFAFGKHAERAKRKGIKNHE